MIFQQWRPASRRLFYLARLTWGRLFKLPFLLGALLLLLLLALALLLLLFLQQQLQQPPLLPRNLRHCSPPLPPWLLASPTRLPAAQWGMCTRGGGVGVVRWASYQQQWQQQGQLGQVGWLLCPLASALATLQSLGVALSALQLGRGTR